MQDYKYITASNIEFNNDFNKEINLIELGGVDYIKFGSQFNQNVDKLPTILTHLIFGIQFDQNVDNLPQKLTHLIFSYKFNQNVDKLPNSIQLLEFGSLFNQNVDNLPRSLIRLVLGHNFNKRLDILPESLEILDIKNINTRYYQYKINDLPSGVKKIIVKKFDETMVNNIVNKIYKNRLKYRY